MLSHALTLWLTLLALPLQAQQIAITLDDLPYVLRSRTHPPRGHDDCPRRHCGVENPMTSVATGFAIGRSDRR